MPFGFELGDFRRRDIEANDLGINLALAHPARDDLRVLRAEIEDEDFRMCSDRAFFTATAAEASA